MEELDLDSFIANIEQTAPEDSLGARLACNECGGHLIEDDDGNYTCPLCSVQATNILQLDATELHHDDQGRPVYGQRVRLAEKKSKHTVDYGWSWSTDDAIFHILTLQLKALNQAKLLPESFIEATMIMWQKYWLDSVAPFIKDDYSGTELVPISVSKALKLRDIEVLVKVKDKVMIPLHLVKNKSDTNNLYRMLGTQFCTSKSDDTLSEEEELEEQDFWISENNPHRSNNSSSTESLNSQNENPQPDEASNQINGGSNWQPPHDENCQDAVSNQENRQTCQSDGEISVDRLDNIALLFRDQTKNISVDSITVLTLNRTLAFLEATARGLGQKDPLFASDLIRACNQRLIPFYGATRLMPENMKFDQRDKLGFQKTRPPTPRQLSRTALTLLSTIHKDELPKKLPVPDLTTILERFAKDMNLPSALFENLQGKASFHDFKRTQPRLIDGPQSGHLPQYDRWAYAILVIHLKTLFNLSNEQIIAQKEKAIRVSRDGRGGDYFIFHDWTRQMSMRLELILRHDPFVLYHPLTEIERMEPTPQLAKYLEQIIKDTAHADITLHGNSPFYDEESRQELVDLLYREIPLPPEIMHAISAQDVDLQLSKEIKYPLGDAFRRTQQFWIDKLDSTNRELVFQSFAAKELVLIESLPQWSIYDCGLTLGTRELKISPKWPEVLILLLHVGAFLCFCQPVDLLDELKSIEEEYHPQIKIIKRINYARKRRKRTHSGCNAAEPPPGS